MRSYQQMKPTAKNTDLPKAAGLIAQFDGPEALVAAAAGTREAGYTRFEAYSPFPVHGIDRAMARRRTGLPWLVLAGGVEGAESTAPVIPSVVPL